MPAEYRESLDKGYGCGEHSDYGCLTLLNMDGSTQALQAQVRVCGGRGGEEGAMCAV
jgi:isopenicillin N synthase-like dioxygenase